LATARSTKQDAVLKDLSSSDRVLGRHGRRAVALQVVESSAPGVCGRRGRERHCVRLKPGIERLDYGLGDEHGRQLARARRVRRWCCISFRICSRALRRCVFADLEPPAQTQLMLHDVGNAAAENVFIQGAQLTTVDTRSSK
jgi:hypothetical protein